MYRGFIHNLLSFVPFMFLFALSGCGSQSKQSSGQLPTAEYSRSFDEGRKAGLAVDAIAEEMQSDDPQARLSAVVRFSELVHRVHQKIPLLIDLLHDPNAEVRENAARFLEISSMQAVEAVPALHGCLGDTDPLVRVQAAKTIFRITGDSQTTIPVLSDAVGFLRGFGLPPDLEELEKRKKEQPEERERRARQHGAGLGAIQALAEMGPIAKITLESVIDLWKRTDQRPEVQKRYSETIAKIDPERAKELGIDPEEFLRPRSRGTGPAAAGSGLISQ